MEATMRMPAYYNVLNNEEMTYTTGGTTLTQAVLSWIPPIGWYKSVMAVRDYRKKNPDTWIDRGLDDLVADMKKDTYTFISDLGQAVWFVSSCASGVGLIVNAALILL